MKTSTISQDNDWDIVGDDLLLDITEEVICLLSYFRLNNTMGA